MVVYKITNTINNKVYIGVTSQLLSLRWAQHCCNTQRQTKSALKSAIIKYGRENFLIAPFYHCSTREDANRIERCLIRKLSTMVPSGYNIRDGGNSASISDYAKIKISEANSKPVERLCPETGERTLYKSVAAAAMECKSTEGSIYQCLVGKISSDNGYQWVRPGETAKKTFKPRTNRPVFGINPSGVRIDFISILAAGFAGFTVNGIQKCLLGHTKQSGGFIWNYLNHDIIKDAKQVRPSRVKCKTFHANYRPIVGRSIETNEIIFSFQSTKEAKLHGFWDKYINHCIAGKIPSYKGLIWESV